MLLKQVWYVHIPPTSSINHRSEVLNELFTNVNDRQTSHSDASGYFWRFHPFDWGTGSWSLVLLFPLWSPCALTPHLPSCKRTSFQFVCWINLILVEFNLNLYQQLRICLPLLTCRVPCSTWISCLKPHFSGVNREAEIVNDGFMCACKHEFSLRQSYKVPAHTSVNIKQKTTRALSIFKSLLLNPFNLDCIPYTH